MSIGNVFSRIMNEYPGASQERFKQHPLRKFIAGRATSAVQTHTGNLRVKGSAGQSKWAETPWIAVMNPAVSTSTQNGFYVVYLFNAGAETVSLSLNQGVKQVEKEFGRGAAQRDVLQSRAEIMRKRLPKGLSLSDKEIRLSERTPLSRSYSWGHIAGKTYRLKRLPSDVELIADLQQLLQAYANLIESGGSSTEEGYGSASESALESRKRKLHERIERYSPNAERVKRLKGYTCEACDLSFGSVYGELGANYIEAHHLRPLAELQIDRVRRVDLVNDFAVLCANCHRMIHRMDDLSNVAGLRRIVKGLAELDGAADQPQI